MRLTFEEDGWSRTAGAFIEADPTAPTQPNALRLEGLSAAFIDITVPRETLGVWARVNLDRADDGGGVTFRFGDSALFAAKGDAAVGWELRYLGEMDFSAGAGTFRVSGTAGHGTSSVDEIFIGEDPEDMVKLNEIWDAIAAACASVTVSNGYSVTVGEVVEGPVSVPAGVNAWPCVQIFFPDEEKIQRNLTAIGTKTVEAQFVIHVACKRHGAITPGRECIEVSGAIEVAVERFLNGQFLELGYVTHVMHGGSITDEYPPEIAKDIRVRILMVVVKYRHDRGNP